MFGPGTIKADTDLHTITVMDLEPLHRLIDELSPS